MPDYTERKFIREEFRHFWSQGQPLPGTMTTAETPAQGFVVEGSQIPPGRFLARSPLSMTSTNSSWQSAILPDRTGTKLTKIDGTDYTDIIADAMNPEGNLELVGVSVDFECPIECEKLWGNYPCPPIGYLDESMRWKVFRPYRENINRADMVSAVHNDHSFVYTETAMVPGDALHVRVEEIIPFDPLSTDPAQLFGGVTKTADGGTMPLANSRFATARVEAPAIAGGAVMIYLG